MSTVIGAPSLTGLLPADEKRGTWGMYLFIATEAMLFVSLFFAYFYLGHDAPRWPTGPDPKLTFALPMTVVLLSSSLVVRHAEKLLELNDRDGARSWVLATIIMGVVFLAIQAVEFRVHSRIEPPSKDAYTGIFYTITSIHGTHVLLGVLMLSYVLLLPASQLGHTEHPPHHALHNAALYWHFVDVVWVFILAILYIAPRFVS